MRWLAPVVALGIAIAPACVNVDSFAGGGEDAGTSPGDASSLTCDADTQTAIDDCGACGNRCPVRANGVPECAAGACTTKCNPGFGDCDGNAANGCESSVREDPANCGACGRNCGGSTCTDGKCAPIKLLSGQQGLYSIVADGSHVYFSSEIDGGAYRCPVASCPAAQKIGTGNERSYYLAVDDNNVYWNNNSTQTQSAPGKVFIAPKAGGPTDTLTAAPHASAANPTMVAQGGANVFWSSNEGTIWRIPKTKSAAPVAVTKVVNSAVMVVVSDTLYIASDESDAVFVCPATGCATPPPTLAAAQTNVGSIATDGTTLFWTTNTDVVSFAIGGPTGPLKRASLAPGGGQIAVDGNDLFWTEQAAGRVFTMPKAGNTPTLIAQNQVGLHGIAADAKFVYWIARGEAAIYKLAR